MNIETAACLVVVFLSGFGWGQWYAERTIRADQKAIASGRLLVSMPLDPGIAEATLGLLQQLVRDVEVEKSKAAQPGPTS